MKQFLLIAITVMSTLAFTVAKSWIILNPATVQNIADYESALDKADLDKYRYVDKRNTLTFDNGLQVELLSANELNAAGLPVNMNKVRTVEPEFDTHPVFSLGAGGIILEVQTRTKVK
jgi:hypothetical protein